jgi:hypothetical protein
MKKVFSLMLYTSLILLLSDNNTFAQIKLITTISGVPVQNFTSKINGFSSGYERLDFTGDGVPDITLFKEADDLPTEEIVFLKITDGADRNNRWEIPLPNGIIAILIGFLDAGSYKPGEGITFKEIVVAEKKGNKFINPVIIRSEDNYENVKYDTFGTNAVLVAAGDINGDGLDDIMIFDPDAKEVQIWGYQ